MASDRFLIAPINSGYQTDLKPWLIPDDAFFFLAEAYTFRGRVRKRPGAYPMNGLVSSATAQQFTRLRINLGNTDGSGNFGPFTVPGAIFQTGQMFSIGTEYYTVYQNGAMLHTGTGTGTYNTATGSVHITGSAFHATAVYFYPATPVTGFVRYYNDELDSEPLFAFDQQFAYTWDTGTNSWQRSSAATNPGDSTWTANDYNLMWGSNYRGIAASDYFMFVTNYFPADGIRYWDGTHWNKLVPNTNSGMNPDYVQTCLMVLPFNHRLVMLNTVENIYDSGSMSYNSFTYVNRARWSVAYQDPTGTGAWYTQAGAGGFLDAPTREAIVSSEFIKDRLIVYFENSTWELAKTGNDVTPFVWQKINTELGSESTFSIVPFDKSVLALDEVGVHSCNGANVERIDWKIPDTIWSLDIASHGPMRAYGIRDYKSELVYWAYPQFNRFGGVYPNNVLIYNYRNATWAQMVDNITAYGYFEQQVAATWQNVSRTWEEITETWNSSRFQSNSLQVVAGNQEGFTFLVDADVSSNAISLQITNMSISGNQITLTVYNHNLSGTEYLMVTNAQGVTGINGKIFKSGITSSTNQNTIVLFANSDQLPISGTYTGGGTLTIVSNLLIFTKQYNFYVTEGLNSAINKIDFLLTTTSDGEVTVNYGVSSSTDYLLDPAAATGVLTGTGTLETSPYALYPLENTQARIWHPIYPFAQGECIQMIIYMTDPQMRNPAIALSDFQLHALCFYTNPTGRLE